MRLTETEGWHKFSKVSALVYLLQKVTIGSTFDNLCLEVRRAATMPHCWTSCLRAI
jgi:hypothetical protein